MSFTPGKLNIVTGKSKTGKSAIGRIIEYVLGSDSFGVFVGAIRDTVSWYGMILTAGDTEVFLARSDPGDRQTTTSMYLQVGATIDPPPFSSLVANTDKDSVRDRLAQLVGIAPNLNEPPPGQTRRPLEARLSHALIYCFQGQNVVANSEVLFHKQNEEFVPQAIRDTFPYFLGAVADDRLEKTIRLRQLRQQIRVLETEMSELEALRTSSSARIRSLLDEAKAAGLISDWSEDTALEVLRSVAAIEVAATDYLNEDPGADLRTQRNSLVSRYGEVQDAIRAAKRYREEQGGFGAEARHQLLRLKSVELLPSLDDQRCPVCEQALPERKTTANDLLESISALNEHISIAAQEEPRLLEYLKKMTEESNRISAEIESLDFRIEAIAAKSRLLREQRLREMARGRTIGRVSLFLESLAETEPEDGRSKQERLERLRRDASALAIELDEESLRERLSTLMASLSRQIGELADRFELEHKGLGIRLDLRQLTLVIEQGGKSVPLAQIGSGENWVGYHLAFFLALHSWFCSMERPVPSFLFIDQPTQAYFPPDSDSEGNLGDLSDDDDRRSVKRMFEIMNQVVTELSSKMQIIVTDHADINEDWFRECVVERWRQGRALIPQAWIEKTASSIE